MGCAAAHPILIRFIIRLTLFTHRNQFNRGSMESGVTNGLKVLSSSMNTLDFLILSNIAILFAMVSLFNTFVLIIFYFFVIISLFLLQRYNRFCHSHFFCVFFC